VTLEEAPLKSTTPPEWANAVLQHPIELLIDHAFLEKKAANNALELLTRWPGDSCPGWVETLTAIARDETAHLAQVVRLLSKRGGKLDRIHKNPYANELRLLVRKGGTSEIVDRLLISALIEARSAERFGVLASAASLTDGELARFYDRLYASELGHYTVFVKLAAKAADATKVSERWAELLVREAAILAAQSPGYRIHSGV
jgi:tRNA-(ms[2]io[6]A)-hydroxylase